MRGLRFGGTKLEHETSRLSAVLGFQNRGFGLGFSFRDGLLPGLRAYKS